MSKTIELEGRRILYDRVTARDGMWNLHVGFDGSVTVSAPKKAKHREVEAYLRGHEEQILSTLFRFTRTEEKAALPARPVEAASAIPAPSRAVGGWWVLYTLLILLFLAGAFLAFRSFSNRLASLPESFAEPVALVPSSVAASASPAPTMPPSPPPHPTPDVTPPPPEEPADVQEGTAAWQPQEQSPEAVLWPGGYLVRVNVQANTVTVYTSDENGEYTLPVRAMVCSTGAATPSSGLYAPGWRQSWQTLFGNVYGQYVTQITGNILFHSVPYTVYGDNGSLEYWEFDKLGTACSAGCIRLQVKDAQWIYDNRDSIAGIEFYSSSDPGPLGKPSAPHISDNERCRNWDPTDPAPGNPWATEPTPTPEPTPSPTPSPSPEPSPSPTPSPEPAPSPEPSPTLSPEPELEPDPTPDASPSPKPEPTPTPSPSLEPTPPPSLEPTPSPSPEPTLSPSPKPSKEPSLEPGLAADDEG